MQLTCVGTLETDLIISRMDAMKKTIIILLFTLNGWGLALDELGELEKALGKEAFASPSFIKECYDLVSLEENPRHVKLLSGLLDMAQSKDSEEIANYINFIKSVLKSE